MNEVLKDKQPNYDELRFSWFKKSETEDDYFSKFVFLYLSFISSLRKRFFHNSISDGAAINSLKNAEQIKLTYLKFIKNDRLEITFEKLITELKREPLKNSSLNNKKIIEVKINDISDWSNLIAFIYAVRNNLFHGEKNPESRRDNLIVYYACTMLRPIVLILLAYEANNFSIDDYDVKRMKAMINELS